MRLIHKSIIAAALAACTLQAAAQHTRSGYFLDSYNYRYQMNPALGNDSHFVAMPALGNVNVGIHGNLHLGDVLYTVGDRTVLFTNPDVPVQEAMSRFGDHNRIGSTDKIDILAGGFRAFGGYNTVTLSAVADVEADVPGALFSLAKEGVANRTYDIRDMRAHASAYAQLALNHSRDIPAVPGLRVGATLKLLVGAGNVDMLFRRAELALGTDGWAARTDADIYASVGGLRFDRKTYTPKHDATGSPYEYVSGANLDDGYSPNGFGLGLDLGAAYHRGDWTFSAALLDLGFIAWGKTQHASTNGLQEIHTDAYTFSADDDASNSFSNEWDRFTDDLSRLYQLRDMGEMSSRTRMLAATVNVGAEYEFPLYRRLSFGLLNTTRIQGEYTWTDFRLSANVSPLKWLSASASLAAGTYGCGFGWMLNLHTCGISFFAGMDHTPGKLCKQGVPLRSNVSANFGIDFPF